MWSIKWASLGCACVCNCLPGWFGALFWPCRIFDTLWQIVLPPPPGQFALSISDRPRPSGQFLVLGRVRTLASWFVHFLAQLDNVKKQASHGTLSQTSEWYIWCIYSLLEECRPYVFVSIVHQKRKIGSEKSTPRCLFNRKEASLTPHI